MKSKSSKKAGTKAVITGLSHLLANTYLLYLKTQRFHWNVVGPNFFSYHKMFEEQYNQLADAVDVIAERIRALGEHTPASFAEFLKLASLKETHKTLDAKSMVQALLNDHAAMADELADLFTVAQEAEDEVTLDLFIERKTEHDKIAWMLRSTLGNT